LFNKKHGEIAPRDLSNIFLAMGKMKQFDETLLAFIENHILQASKKFPLNVSIPFEILTYILA